MRSCRFVHFGVTCALVALGGCSNATSQLASGTVFEVERSVAIEIVPPSDAVLRGDAVWDPTLTTVDGARVTIHLKGGRPYLVGDLCSTAYSATVTEHDEAVVVAVREWSPPVPPGREPPFGCSAEGYDRQITVDLARPLGDRKIRLAASTRSS